ncbi:MAG: hypothetical protein R2741_08080 [Methanolobus sp.]
MPFLITAGVLGYHEFLTRFLATVNRNNSTIRLTVLVLLLIIMIAPLGYTFSIPARNSGDTYLNPYYAPTTVTDYISDWKSNNLYVQNNSDNDSIIITNGFQYTFFYNREPDYYIRPDDEGYFSIKEDGDYYLKYMNNTILIYDEQQFFRIIEETNKTIYINLNTNGVHPEHAITTEKWISDIERDGNKFELVFVGEEPTSKVYRLE